MPTANDEPSALLLVDLYELTMAQAYLEEEMVGDAAFSLFVRRLPPRRNYLLACGLDDALRSLERLAFGSDALDHLESLGLFSERFLAYLEQLRFSGDVRAVPEGTPVFAGEPILELTAPLPEAQLGETVVMNQIHLQTVLASKAARIVGAARGRPVVDFGCRRMHGNDAASKGARAFFIAGVRATSNVAAGARYGIPVAGTMAHSYVQAHDDEYDALRRFAERYPETTLLVDTYDTLAGVAKVVELARELGPGFKVRAVRLDSGDLGELARGTRRMLDAAGLASVEIFASGGLDEDAIAALLARGAPIDGFGVGSEMGVARDAPVFDIAYKLVAYGGRGRIKLSPDKEVLPGRKQVFRVEQGGRAVRDVLGCADEQHGGRPLLVPVMKEGARLPAGRADLMAARERARREIAALPDRIRDLTPADPPYPVERSTALLRSRAEARRDLGA